MTNDKPKNESRQPSAVSNPPSSNRHPASAFPKSSINHHQSSWPAPASPDISGQFARAFCPQRFSVFPTNQRPSGLPQRTSRAAIVRANRVSNFAVRRNQRTAKELRLTHGNGSGQNAKNPEPQSHLSAVSGVRPDNSRNESRQPGKAESGGTRAESQTAAGGDK